MLSTYIQGSFVRRAAVITPLGGQGPVGEGLLRELSGRRGAEQVSTVRAEMKNVVGQETSRE